MTEGTSQGLFIVVAIVIFGIFISLSYTVFGSMSDGLTGLFDTSLDVTYLQLSKGEVIYSNDFREGEIRADSGGKTPRGYSLNSGLFEQDGSYTLTFELEVTEGTLKAIRGHMHTSSDVKLYIDGIEHDSPFESWRTFTSGVRFDEPYVVGDRVSFKLVFTTDRFENTFNDHSGRGISISPNVDYFAGQNLHEGNDAVNYHNIRLIKHN